MNTELPATATGTVKWWRTLIVIGVLGPFLPFFCTGCNLSGRTDYGGLMIGTALWFLSFIIISAITGWHVNAKRGVGPRVGLTLLFVVAACAIGLGVGIAECATAKAIVPQFPL